MIDYGLEINTTIADDGKITLTVDGVADDMREQIMRRVIDTQEMQVREALILLGWTPPK